MGTGLGVLMILGFLLVSVLGLLFVRRWVHPSLPKMDQQIPGSIFGVVGTMYAVMIAFSMFVVWEKHDNAEAIVSQEANQIRDLYIMAKRFPGEEGSRVRVSLCAYVKNVVHSEWGYMEHGRGGPAPLDNISEGRLWKAIGDLWTVFGQIEPATPKENAIYAESLKRLADVSDSRELRLDASQSKAPTIITISLWAGAILTIAFTYFFQVESIWLHSLMTGGLAAFIGLMLFLISVLATPFVGIQSVKSTPFKDLWFARSLNAETALSAKKIFDGELVGAAGKGEAEKVMCLIKTAANMNAKNENGDTALFLDVNAKDNDGYTALMLGVKSGKTEIVQALIEAKADVNAKSRSGDTALILAMRRKDAKIVDLLKSAGANGNP